MDTTINTKLLRARMPEVVEQVRRGARFTVLYQSRPAFRIVPVDSVSEAPGPIENDPLQGAEAVGASADGRSAAEHDETIYSR
jgi:antitoxin (DNA-binding transcriptional repressor) of toxin-antitoxin stability system